MDIDVLVVSEENSAVRKHPELSEVVEETRRECLAELHSYYTGERGLDNYAERIGTLISVKGILFVS